MCEWLLTMFWNFLIISQKPKNLTFMYIIMSYTSWKQNNKSGSRSSYLVVLIDVASGKECGHPGEPANGTLMSTEILFYPGEEIVYSCKKGFLLIGEDKRTCEADGSWSGFLPSCSEFQNYWNCPLKYFLCIKLSFRRKFSIAKAGHSIRHSMELQTWFGSGWRSKHLQFYK